MIPGEKNASSSCSGGLVFSGGPLTDGHGDRYDCAVRLAGGEDAGSAPTGGPRVSGRVELKHTGMLNTRGVSF